MILVGRHFTAEAQFGAWLMAFVCAAAVKCANSKIIGSLGASEMPHFGPSGTAVASCSTDPARAGAGARPDPNSVAAAALSL